MLRRILPAAALTASLACAAIPTCPAGLPLGGIQLRVTAGSAKPPLSVHLINRVEEGDELLYSPVLRPNEKRHGRIAVVIVPAKKQKNDKNKDEPFVMLDQKPADKPARWKIPFRVSLIAYVYGPSGLSAAKVKGFLSKDDELISQLAEYAEKTEKTEALLTALESMQEGSAGQDMGAALQGFASQYGLSNKLDRTQPLDQQTLAVFRNVNPALATYDPITPDSPQRLGQTASLATIVAGMFFGSPVGLAAGGTAMLMSLQTLLFPNEEFRSSFAQPSPPDGLSLCGKRDSSRGRTRVAYLWAVRIPNAGPPHITIESSNSLPLTLESPVKVDVPDSEWRLVERVRDWKLGNAPVKVTPNQKDHELVLDLSKAHLSAGRQKLTGMWDWDPFQVKGEIELHPLSSFEHVRFTDDSHDTVVEHGGKTIVQLQGDDFEFVTKVALLKTGDKYDAPVDTPFSLPKGLRQGPQDRLELKLDSGPLDAGPYTLLLAQSDGKVHKVPVQVLEDPPKIEQLPITLASDETEQQVTLHGEHLERIEKIDAAPLEIKLGAVSSNGSSRQATVKLPADARRGAAYDFRVTAHQYAKAIVFSNAVQIAGPRARIVDVKMALPADLEVALRPGELPAGVLLSAMTRVRNASPNAAMHLFCKSGDSTTLTLHMGDQNSGAKLQSIGSDTLFVSFDPSTWVSGCTLMAKLQNPGQEASDPYRLGRVMRVPRIDSFHLTDELAGDNKYFAVLTGSDLEVIAQAGWDASHGIAVSALPTPIAGQPNKQSLKIALPWPSPAPHSPLYVWLRGDKEGRATTAKY